MDKIFSLLITICAVILSSVIAAAYEGCESLAADLEISRIESDSGQKIILGSNKTCPNGQQVYEVSLILKGQASPLLVADSTQTSQGIPPEEWTWLLKK